MGVSNEGRADCPALAGEPFMNGRRVVTTAIGPTAALLCGRDSAAATVFVPRDGTLQPRATYVGNFPLPGDGDIAALGDGGGAQRTLAQVPHWNGPGPFVISNNYLEGSGENIIFGGSDPSIPDLVTSDIVNTGNLISKPTRWRTEKWAVGTDRAAGQDTISTYFPGSTISNNVIGDGDRRRYPGGNQFRPRRSFVRNSSGTRSWISGSSPPARGAAPDLTGRPRNRRPDVAHQRCGRFVTQSKGSHDATQPASRLQADRGAGETNRIAWSRLSA